MTVLIAGGGIGGLTLALSLHQIGVAAKVFESVSELKPLGVGINVLPHAVRELIELGLLDQLDASGVRTSELAYFSKHGKPIWSEPRGIEAGYNWPQFSIHRGDAAADPARRRDRAARAREHPHQPSSGRLERDGGRRPRRFHRQGRPASRAGSHDGTLLIAADGIHSAIREHSFIPDEGPPHLERRASSGAASPTATPFLSGRTMIMAGHEILKFVCYPISQQRPTPAASPSINWIAERHYAADLPVAARGLEPHRQSSKSSCRWFEDWKFDWLDVPGLIRNCPHAYEYPLVDRDPLAAMDLRPRHADGRRRASDVPDRLQRRLAGDPRRPRADPRDPGARPDPCRARGLRGRAPAGDHATSCCSTARNGPEQVMQMVEERAPDGYDRIEDVFCDRGAGGDGRGLQAACRVRSRDAQHTTCHRAGRRSDTVGLNRGATASSLARLEAKTSGDLRDGCDIHRRQGHCRSPAPGCGDARGKLRRASTDGRRGSPWCWSARIRRARSTCATRNGRPKEAGMRSIEHQLAGHDQRGRRCSS